MVIGHNSPRILMQITKLVGGRGGPVQPQLLCSLLWINAMLEWRKEGRKRKLITAEDQYYFRDRMERRRLRPKKKQFQLHHFFAFRCHILTLRCLFIIIRKEENSRLFMKTPWSETRWTLAWGQAINCFQLKWDQVTWKERKRPCRRSDRFPITKNHSFFQG